MPAQKYLPTQTVGDFVDNRVQNVAKAHADWGCLDCLRFHQHMPRRARSVRQGVFRLLGMLLCGVALPFLAACSPDNSPDKAPLAQGQAYDALAKDARGITVGAMMTSNVVYVMFDPQCPHCAHLWQDIQPLTKKLKFVWVPVAIVGAGSAPQGAALLASATPAQALAAHEAAVLDGNAAVLSAADVPSDIEAAVKKNTDLFNRMGVESVPYIVARNRTTGEVVTHMGAMGSEELAQFLGLN